MLLFSVLPVATIVSAFSQAISRQLQKTLLTAVLSDRSQPLCRALSRAAAMEVQPPLHPYYPISLELPTWQPLAIPFEKILATFFTACGVVLFLGWWLTGLS